MAKAKGDPVGAYIASQPPAAQPALRRVRRIVRSLLPDAEETISYGIPTYKLHGEHVVYFAGWKRHWSLYPVTDAVRARVGSEIESYEVRKGTVRFPLADPVPTRLVERIVRTLARAAEARRGGERAGAGISAESRLAGFMGRYSTEVTRVARSARRKLRGLLPGAAELVYDNYNALVIGFGPNERASDAIVSIALYPRWVSLFFLRGAGLPDPGGVLRGTGSRVRHVVLEHAALLDTPAVRELIRVAVARHSVRMDARQRRRLLIKSVSARQRPRRPVPSATS